MEICLICCMSILLFDFFFGGKPSSAFGRTGVHYRHPFASDQVSFSLVGLVQVYIACIRPTNVSIAIVSVETVFATLLLDDHSLVEQEAEQLFEFRLSVGLFHDFGISRFEGCYQFSVGQQFSGSERLLQSLLMVRVTQLLVGEVVSLSRTIRVGGIQLSSAFSVRRKANLSKGLERMMAGATMLHSGSVPSLAI